jgi:hypothetical protein
MQPTNGKGSDINDRQKRGSMTAEARRRYVGVGRLQAELDLLRDDIPFLEWKSTRRSRSVRAAIRSVEYDIMLHQFRARNAELEQLIADWHRTTCAGCGKTFVRGRADQRFCSTRCRVARWRVTAIEKSPPPFPTIRAGVDES